VTCDKDFPGEGEYYSDIWGRAEGIASAKVWGKKHQVWLELSKQGQSDTRSEKYGVESDFPEPGKSLRDVDFTSERESLEGLDQRCSMTWLVF